MQREQRGWWDGPWPGLTYLIFYPFPWIWHAPSTAAITGSIAAVGLFLPAYWKAYRVHDRDLVLVSLFIVLIGFGVSPLGGGWTTFSIYAGLVLGRLRPLRHATVAVLLVAVATVAWGLLLRQPAFTLALAPLLIVMNGMGSASREAFYDRTIALLATQEEVRRLAGTAERERMVRDLHDVVGRTLTLIAIKSDLANRLVSRDPEAAGHEAIAIGRIARDGLSDVRAALAGPLGGSLVHELQASTDALTAAGIGVRVRGDATSVPRDAGAVLAMTLREAVTNTIRHSRARSCEIAIWLDDLQAKLAVSDDGVGDDQSGSAGSGLDGMRHRLTAAGGSLDVEPNRLGFRLEARVPA